MGNVASAFSCISLQLYVTPPYYDNFQVKTYGAYLMLKINLIENCKEIVWFLTSKLLLKATSLPGYFQKGCTINNV